MSTTLSTPKTNLTSVASQNIDVNPREIDFVTTFGRNWVHLQQILGIVRPIKKTAGATLKVKTAKVTLAQSPTEGDDIPYSKAEISETPIEELTIEKYAKAVSLEAINAYGYETAVAMTDDEFKYELTSNITDRFYTFLKTGSLDDATSYTTFQSALAGAKGLVINKFNSMHRAVTDVVAFVNVMDFYNYLGTAAISVQTAFGMQYISNFMGYKTIVLCGDTEIPAGKIYATPVENIVLYYVDPSSSEFAKAGLQFTVDGETNLIGYHTQGNYNTAVSECFAILGMRLLAEYLDGIADVTFHS